MHPKNTTGKTMPQAFAPGLDGVRGLSCIIILLVHSMNTFRDLSPDIGFLKPLAKPAVACFFVLSGHLIGYHYLSESFSLAKLRTFLIVRFFRVYPLFFLVILVSCIIHYTLPDWKPVTGSFSWGTTVNHWILKEAYARFWTIKTELGFYALFPIFAAGAALFRLRPKETFLFLTTLYIASVIGSYLLPFTSSRVWHYLPFFIAGIITGYTQRQNYMADFKPHHCDAVMIASTLLFILGAYNYLPFLQIGHHRFFFKHAWFFAPVLALLILSVHSGGWLTRQMYANRFMRFTGVISYSMYLIHPLVYFLVNYSGWQVYLRLMSGLTLTILISWILYYTIENPLNRLGKNLSRRWA